MIVDKNTSENTRKRFTDACAFRSIPLVESFDEIGSAAGKPGRKLIAVSDKSFAQSLLTIAQSAN